MVKNNKNLSLDLENAQALCAKIQQESGHEINDILALAKQESERILKEVKAQAAQNKEKALKASDREIKLLEEKIISSLNLEKKRITLEEKNNFIEAVLLAVEKEAQVLRASKDYAGFLIASINEAIFVIDESEIDIFYSFQDEGIFSQEFIKRIKETCRKNTGKEISLNFQKNDFDDIGVLAKSRDNRLMYDNRFHARLGRAHESIYMELLREMK